MTDKPKGRDSSLVVSSSSGGLFNGFFISKKNCTFDKASLVDGRARRVFDMVTRACEAEVYPYQLPLTGRSGPMVQAEGRQMLMLSSYDYLGLIGDPCIDDAAVDAIRKYGTGTGGVRLLTGTIDLHHQMEKELAVFKGMAHAVTFSSGYLANLAVVSALLAPQDRVLLDSLSHRSLVDACRLAGVTLRRFAHNDPASLRRELESCPPSGRTLIVADGVFSMDGDIGPLAQLCHLAEKYSAIMMVDDAHASGVLGRNGRGTIDHFNVHGRVDIQVGTLSKAIGALGGYVCACRAKYASSSLTGFFPCAISFNRWCSSQPYVALNAA